MIAWLVGKPYSSSARGGETGDFIFSADVKENELQWIHVVDPRDWVSLPYRAERRAGGGSMSLVQSDGEEPLLKACLRSSASTLAR